MPVPCKLAESILDVLVEIRDLLHNHKECQTTNNEIWIDALDVRNLYKLSTSTLYRLKRSKILMPSRLGGRDMYLRSEIEEAIAKKRISNSICSRER